MILALIIWSVGKQKGISISCISRRQVTTRTYPIQTLHQTFGGSLASLSRKASKLAFLTHSLLVLFSDTLILNCCASVLEHNVNT